MSEYSDMKATEPPATEDALQRTLLTLIGILQALEPGDRMRVYEAVGAFFGWHR